MERRIKVIQAIFINFRGNATKRSFFTRLVTFYLQKKVNEIMDLRKYKKSSILMQKLGN